MSRTPPEDSAPQGSSGNPPKRKKNDAKDKGKSRSLIVRFFNHPVGKVLLALIVFSFSGVLMVTAYYYNKYATFIEDKLNEGPYSNTSKLYATPQVVNLRDDTSPEEIAEALRRAGYTTSRSNRMGWYSQKPDSVEVYPGPDSYFQQEAHLVKFKGTDVAEIVSLRDNTQRTQFWLEPEIITNLADKNREKRRILTFAEIPQVMVNAVLSAEDKRFFQHAGFDPLRILKSAYEDIKAGDISQGASTISMQLAREIWGNKVRGWKRKIPEVLMTLHLERKLTKNEIFEHYTNQIDLGRVGSFNIHGFGEGAQVFFGKELRKLNIQEAALLAGIVQAPSAFNPLRNPEKARARRNIILRMMRDNGYITQTEYEAASNAPLGVVSGGSESEDAPYFAHYLNDQLQTKFQDRDFQEDSYRVYTTLDINLQKAAASAVKAGVKELNATAIKRGRTAAKGWPPIQAALVAMDAHSGEILAMVGGEDYGVSQLNRALAKRPPGSIFKPFVYAAALNTASEGGLNPVTPATTVVDEATTFWFDDKPYEPGNFGDKFLNGPVTMRYALAHSLNIPTLKFAEMAGYDTIVTLARASGMNNQIKATPAVALGAYEVTPIEIAGAYTVFSNSGVYVEPSSVKLIRDKDGKVVYTNKPKTRNVLDPRVTYMMVDLLQEVMRSGTAAGVRGRGFTLPAAGKTGTSHDAWFAGFTSKIIAVVWVGYDDNRDVKMEGAKAALPIWTEFMKQAHEFSPYRFAGGFGAPDGVVSVEIDSATGKLAAAGCSGTTKSEVFLAGTQPLEYCNGSSATRVMAFASEPEPEAKDDPRPARRSRKTTAIPVSDKQTAPKPPAAPPKKGILDRLFGWAK